MEEEWCISESDQGQTVVDLDCLLFEKEVDEVVKKEESVVDCGECLRGCYWQHMQATHWVLAMFIVFIFIIVYMLLEQLFTSY